MRSRLSLPRKCSFPFGGAKGDHEKQGFALDPRKEIGGRELPRKFVVQCFELSFQFDIAEIRIERH